MVIQAQVTQNRMTKSCKLCQDEKSLKQGLRILNPKWSSLHRIRMKNPRILDPRTPIPRTRNPRISNPPKLFQSQIYNQGSRILNPAGISHYYQHSDQWEIGRSFRRVKKQNRKRSQDGIIHIIGMWPKSNSILMAKVKGNFACEQSPFLPFAEDEKTHSVPDHSENPGDQGCHAREPKLPLLKMFSLLVTVIVTIG